MDAARYHEKVWESVLYDALKKANIELKDVNLIAFSNAPGLGPCLHVGKNVALELKKKLKKPVIGVNHCIAHLEIGKFLTEAKDPVLLYVSGANTQVIAFEAGKYRIFGETLDQGVGNFIDAFARYIGIGFPGGPKIEELARKGKFIEIPYVVKGMDISVSGILTNLKQKYDKKISKEDLSFSLQETVFAMLLEVAERAMAHCNKKELLLGGGVACNSRLKEMSKIMCKERKAKCFIPSNEYLVDNGAMIAVTGRKLYDKGFRTKIEINPYQRTDQVEI